MVTGKEHHRDQWNNNNKTTKTKNNRCYVSRQIYYAKSKNRKYKDMRSGKQISSLKRYISRN